jgi:hypothetical protein
MSPRDLRQKSPINPSDNALRRHQGCHDWHQVIGENRLSRTDRVPSANRPTAIPSNRAVISNENQGRGGLLAGPPLRSKVGPAKGTLSACVEMTIR